MENIMYLIKRDVHRLEKANEYFTQTLINLENNNLKQAKAAAKRCYAISDSIEQRLAAMMLLQLAENKNHKEIMSVLNDIYSYSKKIGGVVYGC